MKKLITLALVLLVSSCGLNAPSEEEIRADFDEALIGNQSCQTDSECTLIYPSCPLGCVVSVNENAASSLTQTANRLVDRFESGNQGCAYSCIPVYPVCVIDRCETREL